MQSMTGYGRTEAEIDGVQLTAELKSVNHRYAEFSIIAPKMYGFLDERIRNYLKNRIKRGKINVFIAVRDLREDSRQIEFDRELASMYVNAISEIASVYSLPGDLSAINVAKMHDIFSVKYNVIEEDWLFERVSHVLDIALKQFLDMRGREGDRLKEDMTARCETIRRLVKKIAERAPKVLENNINRLKERISEFTEGVNYDDGRILTEIAVMSDKLCITEELVRLDSHMEEFFNIIKSDEQVGRKLDFLLQEINREVNTIGSKSNDSEIALTVVETKTEIEKIREQVQNIE